MEDIALALGNDLATVEKQQLHVLGQNCFAK